MKRHDFESLGRVARRVLREPAKRRARCLIAQARETLESVVDQEYDQELSLLIDETIELEERIPS